MIYYCKNCGEQFINDESIICTKCGTRKNEGVNFCHRCKAQLQKGNDYCLKCGVQAYLSTTPKYKITAGLLALAFGLFGAHNFYLGYTVKATIQLLLSIIGLCTICLLFGFVILFITALWGFIEAILIFTGSIYKDKKGVLLI